MNFSPERIEPIYLIHKHLSPIRCMRASKLSPCSGNYNLAGEGWQDLRVRNRILSTKMRGSLQEMIGVR